ARPRPVLARIQRPGDLRRRRRAPRVGEAGRRRRGRRSNRRAIHSSISSFEYVRLLTELLGKSLKRECEQQIGEGGMRPQAGATKTQSTHAPRPYWRLNDQ